jgi:CheY-like chemotaxis protein
VADDDVVSRTLTRESLAQAGFEALEAEDGSKALQSFKETSPELVVLDAEMPNVDGVEACAAPRHLPHMPKDSAPSDPGPPFKNATHCVEDLKECSRNRVLNALVSE